MTEFERQVAEALALGMDKARCAYTGEQGVLETLETLVPRVAAAIEAMAGDMGSKRDALAALRGEGA